MVLSGADTGKGGPPVRAYSPNDGLTPSRPAAEAAVGEGILSAALRRLGGSEGFRAKDRSGRCGAEPLAGWSALGQGWFEGQGRLTNRCTGRPKLGLIVTGVASYGRSS
jgi:hypothetical protein